MLAEVDQVLERLRQSEAWTLWDIWDPSLLLLFLGAPLKKSPSKN